MSQSTVVLQWSEQSIQRSACCSGLVVVHSVDEAELPDADHVVPTGRNNSIGKHIDTEATGRKHVPGDNRVLYFRKLVSLTHQSTAAGGGVVRDRRVGHIQCAAIVQQTTTDA